MDRAQLDRTTKRVLGSIFLVFWLLYFVAPLLLVPIFAYSAGNAWLLFGILFSYVGTASAPSRSSVVTLATLGMIGFWLSQGFSIYQYATFYYFCALWGFLMYRFAEAYDQERKRGTLDNDEDMSRHLDENKEAIAKKLSEWRKENPDAEVSFDVMRQIARSVPMKDIHNESAQEEIKMDMPNSQDDSDAAKFLASGVDKAKSCDYQGAIQDFDKAIQLDPTDPKAYLERSNAKRELKDERGAARDLETFKIMFERMDRGLKANDAAEAAYDSDDYVAAIRNYNMAVSRLPSLTCVYYRRGLAKLCLEDYHGAVEDFNKSIEVNASNKAYAHHQRGNIKHRKLGDTTGTMRI